MNYLTTSIGKGPKNALRKIKILNSNEEVEQVLNQRQQIETALIKQNTYHQKKVLLIKVYYDKIYNQLLKDDIRNKILNGSLQESDCINKEVYEFLKLLVKSISKETTNYRLIENEEWIAVVKQAKRMSTLSIF